MDKRRRNKLYAKAFRLLRRASHLLNVAYREHIEINGTRIDKSDKRYEMVNDHFKKADELFGEFDKLAKDADKIFDR